METELFVIEKSEKSLKLGVKNTTRTFITPILDKLNEDKNVKFARYIETHPELDVPIIQVEMKSGDPAEAVKKVCEDISKYYADVKKA